VASSTQQDNTIGIKDVADKLGTEPRDLRKFVRGMHLGVGRGTRYAWASLADPQVKQIMAAWRKAQKEA
jgi:hypothetical protein